MRNDAGFSVHKAYDSWFVKNVLIVSRKEENTIAPQRAAERESELLLLVVRLDVQFRIARVEGAVPQIIKCRAVKLVGSRLCDNIDYRASGSTRLGGIRLRYSRISLGTGCFGARRSSTSTSVLMPVLVFLKALSRKRLKRIS